jgi:hypothetical protein
VTDSLPPDDNVVDMHPPMLPPGMDAPTEPDVRRPDDFWQRVACETLTELSAKIDALTEAVGQNSRHLDGQKLMLEALGGRTDELITDAREAARWRKLRDADQAMIRIDQQRIAQTLHLRLGKLPSETKKKRSAR